MDAYLRRPQGGAGHAADQVPAAAGAGLGRHRRRSGVENPAPQLRGAYQRLHRPSSGPRIPALPRLSDGRHGRREPLQRRSSRRCCEGPRQDFEDRQTYAGHHRNSLYHDHRVDQGFDHQGQRQGQDQDPKGRRQYSRQGRNRHSGLARRVVGQDHRRALRLHRLRGVDRPELVRHLGREAALPRGFGDPAPLGRAHQVAAGAGAENPAGRVERGMARRLARTHLHREQALPADRGVQEPRGGLFRRG